MDKYQVLQTYFGYPSFRKGQEVIIDNLLSGRDTLAIMPTGAGKSLCYQIPALMMEGITLVISPLVSLMKDQVRSLNEAGVHAAYLNSSLTFNQYQKALALARNYQYKIIYVAPERLLTGEFLDFARHINISMISVDEAHCISHWGQNFRPSYLKIIDFVQELSVRPILCGFTATATLQVKDDIVKTLHLKDPYVTVTGFNRENLYFEVRKPKDKFKEALEYIQVHPGQSGIIYCSTRKVVEDVASQLLIRGVEATRYHAGLSDSERRKNQDDFIYDTKPVMVATNAFGMGIDKPNVNYVIHYNMPKDLESYYQEAGRAGRDGEPANCILLYGAKDVITNQFFIEHNEENSNLSEDMRQFILERDRERLKKMTFYCFTNECLREYILRYFNEYGINYCNNCSNCLTKFEERDVTRESYLLLSLVKDSRQRYGINVILETLRGSKSVRVTRYGLNNSPFYANLSNMKDHTLRLILNHLMLKGFLLLTDEEYPVLKLTAKSMNILNKEETVLMKFAIETPMDKQNKKSKAGSKTVSASKGHKLDETDEDLFQILREVRRRLALEQNVPPYIVFNDRTLREMALRKPQTREQMLEVSGVGAVKFDKYGDVFLKVMHKKGEPCPVNAAP